MSKKYIDLVNNSLDLKLRCKFLEIQAILSDYKLYGRISESQESYLSKNKEFIMNSMINDLNSYEKHFLINRIFKESFTTDHDNEDILCIKRSLLEKNKNLSPDEMINFIGEYGLYLNRNKIEYDPDIVQVVVYVSVRNKNGDIALLARKGGEERLYGKIDLLAGHVRKVGYDCSINKLICESIKREVQEELSVTVMYDSLEIYEDSYNNEKTQAINNLLKGIILPCKDKFDVSHYHLGLVYEVTVDGDLILNNEPDKHDILWFNTVTKKEMKSFSPWLNKSLSYLRI